MWQEKAKGIYHIMFLLQRDVLLTFLNKKKQNRMLTKVSETLVKTGICSVFDFQMEFKCGRLRSNNVFTDRRI